MPISFGGSGGSSGGSGEEVTKASIGLGNVPNVNTTIASNITSGTLLESVLPEITISDYVGNYTDITTALLNATINTSQVGDWFTIDTNGGESYIVTNSQPFGTGDVTQIETPDGGVTSVANKTGAVTLESSDLTDSTNIPLLNDNNTFTGTQSLGNINLGADNSDIVTIKGAVKDSTDTIGTDGKILVSEADGQLVWADSTPPKANTITVAKSGGDYTTIQAAINASTSGDAIIVYPGTYSENITTKAGTTTSIEGIGNMGSVVIESNTGNVLTIPSVMMSMAFIKNLKLKSTVSGSNTSKLVYSEGMMVSFLDVVFDYNISNGNTERIIDLQTGSYVFMNCKFDLDCAGTMSDSTNFIYANGNSKFNILQGFGDISTNTTNAAHVHFLNYSSTATSIIRDFDCIINASATNFAGHLDFIHFDGAGELEVMGSKIVISTPSGDSGSYGQVYHLAGTGGGHIHSTANRISVTGFADNYIGNINATEILYSHFDDIIAEDNIIGTGTYSYVNSPTNGNLQMSGDIVKKLIDITADYNSSESWEFGILNSNATSEITATFNTTEMDNLPNGAIRIFTNSSQVTNLIIDPNTINISSSTNPRAIYPNGYIKMEKIGDDFIIVSSHNTSFNLDFDDVPNKTFHLDFSDVSSITTSGNNITSVTESINGWTGEPTLAGRAKYGLTTQNGRNTALWEVSNTDLSFGNRELHSNLVGRGLTIIAVVKPKYSGDAIISKYADNIPNAEWRFLTNNAVIYDNLNRSGNEATLNFSSNYEEWQIIGMTWEPGGRLSVYKNGFLMGTSAYTTTDIESGTANLMVGVSDISGMDYIGEIGEIIAISDTPTEDMRKALVSKLGAKWGIDTAVFSSSDSSPFGRDSETDTIKPLLDNDNLNIGTGVFSGVLKDGIELESDAAPTTDKMLVNKKYVDDNAGGSDWIEIVKSTDQLFDVELMGSINLTELQFSVVSGKKYVIDLELLMKKTSNTASSSIGQNLLPWYMPTTGISNPILYKYEIYQGGISTNQLVKITDQINIIGGTPRPYCVKAWDLKNTPYRDIEPSFRLVYEFTATANFTWILPLALENNERGDIFVKKGSTLKYKEIV